MRLLQILRSMGAVAFHELGGTLLRPKMLITATLIGVIVVVAAWLLGNAALAFAAAPPSEDDEPAPPSLWETGGDGALVTLAFGIIPLILPLLPIIVVADTISLDQSSGFFERSLHRPVPRWSFALAKVMGIFAALAIPTTAFFLIAALLIPSVAGSPVTPGLVLVFLGSTLLLLAFYASLVLVFAMWFSPGITLTLLLFLWLLFNAVSRGAFSLGGQFFLVVPIQVPQTFQVSSADGGTFTGLYLGLLARFIPPELGFIVTPGLEDWPGMLVSWMVPLLIAPWLVFLVVVFILLHHRFQVA